MTLPDLLMRFDRPRKTGRGWVARCPAHSPDRHPSLSLREGQHGILLYDFAGCTVEEICAALGITVADLFFDKRDIPSRRAPRTEPRPLTTKEMECVVWSKAVGYELRGLTVLDLARGMDTAEWTDEDFDTAMSAVCSAREDLRMAELLHELAFAMRETDRKRRKGDASRHRAA